MLLKCSKQPSEYESTYKLIVVMFMLRQSTSNFLCSGCSSVLFFCSVCSKMCSFVLTAIPIMCSFVLPILKCVLLFWSIYHAFVCSDRSTNNVFFWLACSTMCSVVLTVLPMCSNRSTDNVFSCLVCSTMCSFVLTTLPMCYFVLSVLPMCSFCSDCSTNVFFGSDCSTNVFVCSDCSTNVFWLLYQ